MYRFSSSSDPGEHWFRVGTVDVNTTILATAVGVVSIFVWAFSKTVYIQLPFYAPLVRTGDFWRIITWPLANPLGDIALLTLLGMLFFYWFAQDVERSLGKARFLAFLVVLTLVPGLLATGLGGLGFGLASLGNGFFLIFVLRHPNERTWFSLPIWVFGVIILGIDVLQLVGNGDYDQLKFLVVELVVAFLFMRSFGLESPFTWVPRIPLGAWAAGEGPSRPSRQAPPRAPRPSGRRGRHKGDATVTSINRDRETPHIDRASQADMDRLLDKISASGVSSLTPEERRRLDEHSRRLRGQ